MTFMADVTMEYSNERGTWNVIVDGEWYYEGNYEQAENVFNSFFWSEDNESYEDDYEPDEERW